MEFEEIDSFLKTTLEQVDLQWEAQTLSAIANQRVPDFIATRGYLLRADIHILWTKWFLESIYDPDKCISLNQNYFDILSIVKKHVPHIFPNVTKLEQNQIIRYLAQLIDTEVRRRKNGERVSIDKDTRELLIDLCGTEPRCWICGYKFSESAVENFLNQTNNQNIPLPEFVNYVTLQGLKVRHLRIEVDHIIPFSKGGQDEIDNYSLSCGWCNSHKSDRISIYDVPLKLRNIEHPIFGLQSIPHPFWIVRLLSIRRCCEYEQGCKNTVENSHLRVIPRNPEGAMNPTNLKVVCREHDPLGSDRLVARAYLEKLL